MRRRLLVTGGSGLLGSRVARQGAAAGWEAVATSRRNGGVDITRLDDVRRLMRDLAPHAVVHTAYDKDVAAALARCGGQRERRRLASAATAGLTVPSRSAGVQDSVLTHCEPHPEQVKMGKLALVRRRGSRYHAQRERQGCLTRCTPPVSQRPCPAAELGARTVQKSVRFVATRRVGGERVGGNQHELCSRR